MSRDSPSDRPPRNGWESTFDDEDMATFGSLFDGNSDTASADENTMLLKPSQPSSSQPQHLLAPNLDLPDLNPDPFSLQMHPYGQPLPPMHALAPDPMGQPGMGMPDNNSITSRLYGSHVQGATLTDPNGRVMLNQAPPGDDIIGGVAPGGSSAGGEGGNSNIGGKQASKGKRGAQASKPGPPKKAKKEIPPSAIPSSIVTESSGVSEIDEQLAGVTPKEEMTAEEKQRASRNRNREHARNTRLRKKAYLAQLQNTVANLQEEAASSAAQNAQNEEKIHKQRALNTKLLLQFLAYRATFETSRAKYTEILDDNFFCTCPVTPYRSFPHGEVVDNQRRIKGINGMINDSQSLKNMGDELVNRSLFPHSSISFRYHIKMEDIVMGANQLMTKWKLVSHGVKAFGGKHEVENQGMLKCTYSEGKIASLHIVFDVMAFMLELKEAKGQQISEPFRIIPNTIVMARKPSNEPRMLLYTQPPNTICETNKAFCDLFGYAFEDIINKWTLDKVGGNEKMRTAISSNFPVNHVVTCQGRDGTRFFMNLKLFPLTNGETPFVSHYLGVCQQVKIDPSVFQRESNVMQQQNHGAMVAGGTHPSIATNPEFAKQMAMASCGRGVQQEGAPPGGFQHHQQQQLQPHQMYLVSNPTKSYPGSANLHPAQHPQQVHVAAAQHPAQHQHGHPAHPTHPAHPAHPAHPTYPTQHPTTYASAYPVHPGLGPGGQHPAANVNVNPAQIMGAMGGGVMGGGFGGNMMPMGMGDGNVGGVPMGVGGVGVVGNQPPDQVNSQVKKENKKKNEPT